MCKVKNIIIGGGNVECKYAFYGLNRLRCLCAGNEENYCTYWKCEYFKKRGINMFTVNVILETLILILLLISVALLQINIIYSLYCIISILGLYVGNWIYNKIRGLEDE